MTNKNTKYWIDTLPKEVAEVARTCEASLCILHYDYFKESITNGGVNSPLWFMDEEICSCYRKNAVILHRKQKDGKAPLWIKRQKRLQKRGVHRNTGFNYQMLTRRKNITINTKGINPNRVYEIQFKRFIKGENL